MGYIVYTLFFGLKESQNSQPECARDLVKYACYATVISWCTYPVVYIFPMLSGSDVGKAGLSASAMVSVQVGYTISLFLVAEATAIMDCTARSHLRRMRIPCLRSPTFQAATLPSDLASRLRA